MNTPKSQEQNVQQEAAELTLRDYWDTVLRYRFTFIMVVLIVLMTSFSMHVFMPKKYSATAKLLGLDPTESVSPLEHIMGKDIPAHSDPGTISKIAQSHRVLESTLKHTLNEFNAFKAENTIKAEESFLAEKITLKHISQVTSIRGDVNSSDILNVSAALNDAPYLSASLANGLSYAILETLTENNRKAHEVDILNINNSIKKNEEEIQNIDDQLKTILSQESDFKLSLDERRLSQRLDLLESQLSDADLRKKEIDDQINSIKIDFGINDVQFEKVRWIDVSSTMHQKLQNLKFEREELLTRYLPENPSIKKLDNQIESLEETLKPASDEKDLVYVEVDRFKTGIVSRLLQLIAESSAIEKRFKHIKKEIEATQQHIIASPEQQKKIIDLRKKREIFESLQLDLHTNLQTSKMLLMSTNSNFELLEKAIPASHSSSPGLGKYIVIGFAFGVALAFCVVIVLKNWENTLKSSHDLKRHLHYPSLGAIPNWKHDEMFIDEMQPDSRIAEVYGVLRNHIRFSSHEQPEKCLLVASALQGEGKSITATNLALSFALEGNQVLLISADLRRPESLTRFLATPQENGIVEYLEGKVEMKDVIFTSSASNLSIVPTIHRANNPTRLIKDKRFKELIDYGEHNFDVLIIDSPAILPVVDSTMFANQVRGVLILAQADQTPINSIQEMVNRLQHVEAPIIGVCLNKIMDLRLEYMYSYGGSQYYGYQS